MANQLTKPVPIRVGKAVIYAKSTAVTVVTTNTLLSLFTASSDIFNKAKNVVITPPVGAIDKIDLLGETTSTKAPLQTFQNYLLEEKSWSLAKITGTLLLDGNNDESIFDLMISDAGTAGSGSGSGYTFHQYGGSDSSKARKVGSIMVHFPISSADIRSILLNNLFITNLGDIKATGADGHLERDFEAICAPEDYVDLFKD